MITIQMSSDQVRAFANTIHNDIATYVEDHKKEHEEYLQNMGINEMDYGD